MNHHDAQNAANCTQRSNRQMALTSMSLLLVALLTLSWLNTAEAQGRPALVAVDAVIIELLVQTQPIQGRFVARQAGPVAARTRGTVTEVHVLVGDRVAKGDPLITLDTQRLAAEVERHRGVVEYRAAQVVGAQTRHSQAADELARMERLRKSAAFSRARHNDQTSKVAGSKSEIAEYNAQLRTSRAELTMAELDLNHSVVRAPFSGVIVRQHIQAGAYVRDGDPVAELIDDLSLEIEADVPSIRVVGLTKGLTVSVSLETEKNLSAVVRAVVPQENGMSRTRAVRFAPNFDPVAVGAAAEASVTVRVPLGLARDVITVHKDAVVQQGGAVVYVVEDGKAARKRVILGEPVGSRFVVKSGLEAGMMAVVRGNERLRPGQDVHTGGKGGKPKAAGATPGPAAKKGSGEKPSQSKKGADS
jgi:RND family efflux transporter MFP subunit